MNNGKRKKYTEDQLRKLGYYKNADGSWSREDSDCKNKRSQTKELESNAVDGSKAKNKPQSRRKEVIQKGTRYRIVVHSYRTKLIDPSNACFKAIEDCLVTHGYIPDDSSEYCDQPLFLQTKVSKGDEKTIIDLYQKK